MDPAETRMNAEHSVQSIIGATDNLHGDGSRLMTRIGARSRSWARSGPGFAPGRGRHHDTEGIGGHRSDERLGDPNDRHGSVNVSWGCCFELRMGEIRLRASLLAPTIAS